MQQLTQPLSNTLLSNSSKTAETGSKGSVLEVENTSFLSAYHQASGSVLVKPSTVSFSSQELSQAASQIEADDGSNADSPADIELIFAQLNMAETLTKNRPVDGNILPQSDQLVDGSVQTSEIQTELLGSQDVSDANEDIMLDNVAADLIDLPNDSVVSADFLNQLSVEEQQRLMAFSGLTLTEMQSLDNQSLGQLVDEANLATSLAANIGKQSMVSGAASVTGKTDAMSPATSQNSTTQSALSASVLAPETVNTGAILGDKTRVDGNIQADSGESPLLSNADFSVVLNSVSAKKMAGDTFTALTQTAGVDVATSANEIDSKTLQNLSSFTPVNKSDVPQLQMSLRPQGEPGGQMQEMIQRFSPVMKQQLITMVSNGIQQAEIRLDPPELGHLTVKIQIHGDQTQVQFTVAQSQTRDIVEQAMPRLRDMLAQEGLQLTDSQVSQGGEGNDQQGQSAHQGGAESQLGEISAQEVSLVTNPSRSLHSAIDYYA